jgi:hypothetical protein
VRRGIRWTLAGVGAILLLAGGGSIFWRPSHEVLYRPSRSVVCQPTRCIGLYELEVGNTGHAPQPDVRLHLRAAVVAAAPVDVRVKDFGKTDRPVAVSTAADVRTYALGPLLPDRRVVLSLVLLGADAAGLPGWDAILVGVEPATGAALPGNPGAITLLRIWYRLVRPL